MTPRTGRGTRRAASSARVLVTPAPERPVPAFGRWVGQHVTSGAAVLNVGGGCDSSGTHPLVRRRARRLVVVDPGERVHANREADERHQLTLEDFAVQHAGEFDAAYAVFVLEHVAHPTAFCQGVARVLRPGGVFFAITPNQRHYFGFAAWAAHRLHVEQALLSMLRDRETIDSYHVPTEYRLNSIRSVSRHLADAGFVDVEFRMWDLPRMYEPYLPGPTKGIARAWNAAVYRTGRAGLMGHLTVKAVKG